MREWLRRQRYLIDYSLSALARRPGKHLGLLLVYTPIVFLLASVMLSRLSTRLYPCLLRVGAPVRGLLHGGDLCHPDVESDHAGGMVLNLLAFSWPYRFPGYRTEARADTPTRETTRWRVGLARWAHPLLLLMATTLLGACGDKPTQLTRGEPTPPFELSTLGGPPIALPADLRGQVVAVRFWADWCPFCESEMRSIEPVYRRYRDQGLRLLAINVRQDRETAAAFVEPLGISYDVLLDPDGAVARSYGVSGLPTTFLLDRQGRLAARILGESTPEVFEQVVKELL